MEHSEPLVAARAPRIRLRVTMALTVGTLLVLLAAGLAWATDYQPLTAIGQGGGYGPATAIASVVDPDPSSYGAKTRLYPRRGDPRFGVSFSLWNTGSFAIDVDGLPKQHGPRGILQPYELRLNPPAYRPDRGVLSLRESSPFERTRIEPGRTIHLYVAYRIGACANRYDAGVTVTSDHLRLRYSYLGVFHRTASVELPFVIALKCAGPYPKPTR